MSEGKSPHPRDADQFLDWTVHSRVHSFALKRIPSTICGVMARRLWLARLTHGRSRS